MNIPIGFLVVRSVEPARPGEGGSLRSQYNGVDRVPPYPSDDEGEQDALEQGDAEIEHLGYDVAAVRGDYWSIVADLSPKEWASSFRKRPNGFGLFARRTDADEYLKEYRNRREADSDSPFDVLYVVRVLIREPKNDGTVRHLRALPSRPKRK